ncbi:MAG: amidoligase family protein [Alphaproteobacteria bacterium]|nr:amidoligase family protein [Alphaproteobacteria bacterium]
MTGIPTKSAITPPPSPEGPDGAFRRVGLEFEFAALRPRDAAELVRKRFGGEIRQNSPHRYTIEDSNPAPFRVELDAQYVHPNDRLREVDPTRPWLSDLVEWIRELDAETSRILGDLAGDLVPCEIVAPPIEWPRLMEMETLYRDLGQAGAAGTDEGLLYAFGLHLNVETTGEDVADILPTMQAYLLLSPWLRSDIRVDGTRRAFPYIDPFPTSYLRHVCRADYSPDLKGLIADYLSFNNTRNRELDMLPLFAHLRGEQVRAVIDDPRIKPRPTYHWRLPNTLFSENHAGPIAEWRRWLAVERLASDRSALESACRTFQTLSTFPLSGDLARFSESLGAEYRL